METIKIDKYPELKLLAWNIHLGELTGEEALGLYENGWRYISVDSLTNEEAKLIDHLAKTYGQGVLNV